MSIGKNLDKEIQKEISKILSKTKFPAYDNICPDTFAELIDRLIIQNIRYWYLDDAMTRARTSCKLQEYRRKAEVVFQVKRPMLVLAIDKLILNLVKGKIKYSPENLKHYRMNKK